MASKRYNQEIAVPGINGYDSPLPGVGLREPLNLLIVTVIAAPLIGLGLSTILARTLADVLIVTAQGAGITLLIGSIGVLGWFFVAGGFAKKMHKGLMPDPEPKPPAPEPDYEQPYQNTRVRIIPAYRNELSAPAEKEGPWEPTNADIREFVMGWNARGGHQQAKWIGFRLSSGVTINARRWQQLCKPLRDMGILNGVGERITGEAALTPAQIVERLETLS